MKIFGAVYLGVQLLFHVVQEIPPEDSADDFGFLAGFFFQSLRLWLRLLQQLGGGQERDR